MTNVLARLQMREIIRRLIRALRLICALLQALNSEFTTSTYKTEKMLYSLTEW